MCASNYGFRSCFHNVICVRAYASDERESHSSTSRRLDLQNNQRSLEENIKTSTSCSRFLIFINCYFDFLSFSLTQDQIYIILL